MSTTVKGDLTGFDTEDRCEYARIARDYNYTVTASGGGTLRFKAERYTGDQIGPGTEFHKGHWETIEERIKIESGHTTTGRFTLPVTSGNPNDMGALRLIFSRGVGTKGVSYDFTMEPA
jgi:hypothetical protein